MAVESIRAAIEEGNVAGDHFLVASREMACREVNFIREFHHLTEKIGPRAETFDDAGDLLTSGASAPEIVGGSGFAGGFSVFGNANFCGVLIGCRIGPRAGVFRPFLFTCGHRRLHSRSTIRELFFRVADPAIHGPARQHHGAAQCGLLEAVAGKQNQHDTLQNEERNRRKRIADG